MNKSLAVLVLGYSRPELIQRCIQSIGHLGLPSSTDVFCSIDKWHDESIKERNEETVRVVKHLQSLSLVDYVIERQVNLGCAVNVTRSVTELLKDYSSVFVVEDDLEFVENSENLVSVFRELLTDEMTSFTAYCHSTSVQNMFWSCRFSSQTWFTTRNHWENFCLKEMKRLVLTTQQRSDIRKQLGSDMLRDFRVFQSGKLDTWAVPWNVFNYLEGRKMLYPPRSYVINNSHISGAERTKGIEFPYELEVECPEKIDPNLIIENRNYLEHFSRFQRFSRRLKSLMYV